MPWDGTAECIGDLFSLGTGIQEKEMKYIKQQHGPMQQEGERSVWNRKICNPINCHEDRGIDGGYYN